MANENKATITEEQLATAVATATADAKAEGMKEGAVAERARVKAIVESDEGKKRPAAAIKMATNEKLAALDAAAISELLADMPEEKPKADAQGAGLPKGMLKAAMAGSKQPDVTADAGDEGEDDEKVDPEEARAKAALAMIRKP